MLRYSWLRKTLLHLVVASLPLGVGACSCPPNEYDSAVVELDRHASQYAERIEQCLSGDTSDACLSLCRAVLENMGETSEDGSFADCYVVEKGADAVDVHMRWLSYVCEGAGRRPDGLCSDGLVASGQIVGDYFAQMAHLEGAAVYAFVAMARELARFGAPQALVQRALGAARQEVVHTHYASALASRYGATPMAPEVSEFKERPLVEFAIENAVEGCVRETFGAAVATWQAQSADDPAVRAVMRRIAEDETDHAEFSAAVHGWVMGELDEGERARVQAARDRAVTELLASQSTARPEPLRTLAGLPAADQASRLAEGLRARVWAASVAA